MPNSGMPKDWETPTECIQLIRREIDNNYPMYKWNLVWYPHRDALLMTAYILDKNFPNEAIVVMSITIEGINVETHWQAALLDIRMAMQILERWAQ